MNKPIQSILFFLAIFVISIIIIFLKRGTNCVIEKSIINNSSLAYKAGLADGDNIQPFSFSEATKTTSENFYRTDWDKIECPGTKEEDKCDLEDRTKGIPTILLSLGRSGSSVIWDTMAELAGGEKPQLYAEALGSDPKSAMEKLLEYPDEHGKCFLERIMCARQKDNEYNISRIFGTKWKPFDDILQHKKTLQALQWVADNPHIRLVYNERNPLDVILSGRKHQESKISAHCYDEKCVQKHMAVQAKMDFQVEGLEKRLRSWESKHNSIQELIDNAGISDYIHVSYEKLFYNHEELAVEWMRIFRYLGVGPTHMLSQSQVTEHTHYLATSSEKQSDKISNYDEVIDTLKNTRFAKFLDN